LIGFNDIIIMNSLSEIHLYQNIYTSLIIVSAL